ncbi:MAG: hypothetical protein EOM10_12980 [Opitutae bacterium]|nr:hypothetical protein [Opitutae bacterium]
MNATTTPAFTEFQTGINEALAELDKLARYCADTLAVDPCGAAKTVEDLQGQIQDAADLIHAHFTLYKRAASKGRAA